MQLTLFIAVLLLNATFMYENEYFNSLIHVSKLGTCIKLFEQWSVSLATLYNNSKIRLVLFVSALLLKLCVKRLVKKHTYGASRFSFFKRKFVRTNLKSVKLKCVSFVSI